MADSATMSTTVTAHCTTSGTTVDKVEYLLGSTDEETTRLIRQGNVWAPLTRRVFI